MAFIRKKRDRTEECPSALIVTAKKFKNKESAATNLFYKHAGFVTKKENITDIIKQVSIKVAHGDDNHGNTYKRTDLKKIHCVDVRSKRRNAHRLHLKNKRLEVVNYYRGILENTEEDDKEVTIIDVSDDRENEPFKEQIDGEDNCVYDIYYSCENGDSKSLSEFSQNYSVCEVEDQCEFFDNHLYNVGFDEETSDIDSEDSNDENNWRNDYPDKSDDSGSDVGLNALNSKFGFCDLEDSLSDDECYGIKDDNGGIINFGRKNGKYARGKSDYYEETAGSSSYDEGSF